MQTSDFDVRVARDRSSRVNSLQTSRALPYLDGYGKLHFWASGFRAEPRPHDTTLLPFDLYPVCLQGGFDGYLDALRAMGPRENVQGLDT